MWLKERGSTVHWPHRLAPVWLLLKSCDQSQAIEGAARWRPGLGPFLEQWSTLSILLLD